MPLDYLLSIMRDERVDEQTRIAAARAAAPYFHPRLLAVGSALEGDVNDSIIEIRRTSVHPQDR
jgi:hypothetical protein